MGRTAKYKKVKAFDPYSKKNGGRISLETVGVWGLGDNGVKPKKRSKTAERLKQEKANRKLKRQANIKSNNKVKADVGGGDNDGFNRPPSGKTDDFDMADLQGSLKRDKPSVSELLNEESPLLTVVKSSAASNNPQQNNPQPQGVIDKHEIKEATQLLKSDPSNNKMTTKHQGRQEHESKNAFARRVKGETRQIIKQQKVEEKNPLKRQLKKEFLNQKKRKKGKKGTHTNANHYNDDDNDDDESTPDYPVIPFGDQVERPPTFKTLPRGAIKAGPKADSTALKKTTRSSDQDVKAEQEKMEQMRRQVQNQYAMIKAKRKSTGDFHL